MPRYNFAPPRPDYPAASVAHLSSAALTSTSSASTTPPGTSMRLTLSKRSNSCPETREGGPLALSFTRILSGKSPLSGPLSRKGALTKPRMPRTVVRLPARLRLLFLPATRSASPLPAGSGLPPWTTPRRRRRRQSKSGGSALARSPDDGARAGVRVLTGDGKAARENRLAPPNGRYQTGRSVVALCRYGILPSHVSDNSLPASRCDLGSLPMTEELIKRLPTWLIAATFVLITSIIGVQRFVFGLPLYDSDGTILPVGPPYADLRRLEAEIASLEQKLSKLSAVQHTVALGSPAVGEVAATRFVGSGRDARDLSQTFSLPDQLARGVAFDRRLELEFHGARITSDACVATNCACGSPRWPTCCWRRCGGSA